MSSRVQQTKQRVAAGRSCAGRSLEKRLKAVTYNTDTRANLIYENAWREAACTKEHWSRTTGQSDQRTQGFVPVRLSDRRPRKEEVI